MGMTQPKMAEKPGVSKRKLGLWERGYTMPTEAERLNLVAVLGVSP